MTRVRVIPILLMKSGGLHKSVKFSNHQYIGDPINAVRIFNEKEVDELILLDIAATSSNTAPDFSLLRTIAEEAFMPMAYGGGLASVEHAVQVLNCGFEKVVFNAAAINNPSLITEVAKLVGSSSVVVSIDYAKDFWGKLKVYTNNGKVNTNLSPFALAKSAEQLGAGEIILNSIDRDGTYKGYDIATLSELSRALSIPLIVAGGASGIDDFTQAIKAGASAAAAGSMFVFRRPHNAVLINYPTQKELKETLYANFK